MVCHLLPAAALVVSAALLNAQSASDSVRRLDSAFARSYAVHDTVTAQSLFARDIVITGSSGAVKTREQELDDIRPNAAVRMHYFRTQNVGIHPHGNGATVVGEAQWEFTMSGQVRNVARRYTATWTRGGPFGWQIVSLHFFPSAVAALPAGVGVEGRWEGALGGQLRLLLEIAKAADGLLTGTLTSIDQGGSRIPIDRVRQAGDSLHVDIGAVGGAYVAALSANRMQLVGEWRQGGRAQPLALTRAAAAPTSAPTAATTPAPPSPLGLLLDLSVPVRPTAVAGGGKRHLTYELHITNFTGGDLLLRKVEALNGTTSLASYEGASLTTILQQPRMNVTDPRAIPPGGRAIALIWLTVDSGGTVPASIRHRISTENQTLESAAIAVAAAKPMVLSAPFRGADWRAANGPANASQHRRALVAVGGRTAIAQRFAIDWVKVGPNGSTFNGNQLDNKAYYAYGAELLAVADGIVSATKDSIPENIPGATSRAVPINLETVGGNYVILDLGGGRYAFYAHLQPGTLRVKKGDRVKRGQVLGLLGNSGNSTEPHLHFHLMDGTSPLGSEGLPYVIDSWDVKGASGAWEPRRNQMPMQNEVVRFLAPRPPRKP